LKSITRKFPSDADGDVLQAMYDRGVDLSIARDIEFYCYAENFQIAQNIVEKVRLDGFKNEIFQNMDEKQVDKIFSVYFICHMVPDHTKIINIQNTLNRLLKEFKTSCDGWGTLST